MTQEEKEQARTLGGKRVSVLGAKGRVTAVITSPMVYFVPDDKDAKPQWAVADYVKVIEEREK